MELFTGIGSRLRHLNVSCFVQVQAVVAKQSKSWEMLQPRDSVIDTQQSTVEPEPEPEPEPERRETPVVQKELEEADQQKTAELKTNRHQKR